MQLFCIIKELLLLNLESPSNLRDTDLVQHYILELIIDDVCAATAKISHVISLKF
jgi:hypothetical protein